MTIRIKTQTFDTMGEACERLGISRNTFLRYIDDGFFTKPPTHKQGAHKYVRYFTEDWYAVNQPKLADDAAVPAEESLSPVDGNEGGAGAPSADSNDSARSDEKDVGTDGSGVAPATQS